MSEELIRYVQEACDGSTDAMARLFSSSLKESYYLAFKLTGDSALAVEITKKSYARAFCTIKALKKPEAFGNWMRHNVATVYKETQEFDFMGIEEEENEKTLEFLSDDVYTNSDKAVAAVYAVDNLSIALRTMIVLHYYSGMPVSSLSKHFGTNEGVVNTLLKEAKETVADACASGEIQGDGTTLPVLTRLLQAQMETISIPGSEVKDIFTYAIDIYQSFKEVESKKLDVEGSKKIVDDTEKTAPSDATTVIAFEPSIPTKDTDTETSNIISLDIPKADSENQIDFDAFTDTPNNNSFTNKKKGFDLSKLKNIKIAGLGIKQLGIIAGTVLVVLILIIIIASSSGKDKNNDNDTTNPSGVTAQVIEADGYKWVPGGFEECMDISYLDENCAKFKSVKTGKYGLLSYDGKVIMQPNYDDFQRCGYGRDYDGDNNYHTLVFIDGEQYFITVANGVASVQPNPHGKHGVTAYELDKEVKYDERDRYFEGYAAAEKKGKWGYVSQETDKKVIDFAYEPVNNLENGEYNFSDYCRPVTNGLVAVKKDGKMGIVSIENKTVVPFEYDNILVGSNGIFIACKEGTWGVILVGDAINTFGGIKIEVSTAMTDPDVVAFESETRYFCIASLGANVRADAGTSFDKIDELNEGDDVIGLGTKETEDGEVWLQIRLDNGSYGYVMKKFMREVTY